MAKRLLLTVALTGLAAALIAQSSPPSPSPTLATQNEERHAGDERDDNRQADKPAFNQSTTHYETGDSQDHQRQDETANETIAKFTIVLAIVGLLQVVATIMQAVYMHKGLKVTRVAADAAKISADAATKAVAQAEQATSTTQRAAVLIESIVGEPQTGGAHPYFSDRSVVVFTLKNYGTTVAYDVKISGGVKFSTGSMDIKGAQGVTMAPQGSNKWITVSLLNKIPPDEINKINIGNQTLTYEINATYADAFGKTHEYRAAGQYVPLLRGFITGYSTSD